MWARNIESVVIGQNVISIGDRAFQNTNFKTITFKTRNYKFDASIFSGNSNFVEIRIEGNEDLYKVEDNILYSKDGEKLLLCPYGRIGELIIPNKVKIIGYCACHSCSKITSLVIGDSVVSTEYGAFSGMSSLSQVTIGRNVTSIGMNTFNVDGALKNVIIDSPTIAKNITSQTSCGKLAYYLECIYIKDNITEIGNYITENYAEVISDKDGYLKYIKNV